MLRWTERSTFVADADFDDAKERLRFSRQLLRGLMALLPGFEFHSMKGMLLPEQYANFLGPDGEVRG